MAFHIDAVWVFKKPLLQYEAQSTSSLLPVGEQSTRVLRIVEPRPRSFQNPNAQVLIAVLTPDKLL